MDRHYHHWYGPPRMGPGWGPPPPPPPPERGCCGTCLLWCILVPVGVIAAIVEIAKLV